MTQIQPISAPRPPASVVDLSDQKPSHALWTWIQLLFARARESGIEHPVFEFRMPKTSKGTVSGYFDDPQKLAQAAADWDASAIKRDALYCTLNPVKADLLARANNCAKTYSKHTTGDKEIERRLLLGLDFDADRPAGISSTDAEHEAAIARAREVGAWLSSLGWPDPLLGDSGNGAHLVYAIDLPNDDDSTYLIERCIRAVQARFPAEKKGIVDSEIRIITDTSVTNASRVWKLYGTCAKKGDPTLERPHRIAKILSLPQSERLRVVPRELLEAVAAQCPAGASKPKKSAKRSASKAGGAAGESGAAYEPDLNVPGWCEKHNLTITKSEPYGDGGTLWELECCPLDPAHSNHAACIIKFARGVVTATCLHDGCAGKGWREWRAAVGDPLPESASATGADGRPLTNSYLSVLTVIRENRAGVVGGQLRYDEMCRRTTLDGRELSDPDLSAIRARIEERIKIARGWLQASLSDVRDAVLQVASERPYHPVRDYLSSLVWDGTPRIEHVASEILHAEDTPINRALLLRWFISAVARPMEPGCKVDTVLVLIGPQGVLKSTFFRVLAGDQWFIDTPINLHSDDAYATLQCAWLAEWSELESLRRARDADAVKAFIASQADNYRAPYARLVVKVPRTSIIVGTINPKQFLDDETGNRRWWPVDVGGVIEIARLKEWRDQLWAEAVTYYRAGEQWWLTPEEDAALPSAQEAHETTDPWTDLVLTWAAAPRCTEVVWGNNEPQEDPPALTTGNILQHAIGKPTGNWSRGDEMRVAKILKRAGYVKSGERSGTRGYGGRVWSRCENR